MRVCKICGTELAENAAFCKMCGATAEECATQIETGNENKAAAKKISLNITALIGALVGIAAFVVGVIMLCCAGNSLSYASFGGDFYTYTYRGIREVADQLNKVISALSCIVMVSGAFMSCYFAGKIKKD